MKPHEYQVTCFCDNCIMERIREKVANRESDKLAEDYIRRRGGLDRAPNIKRETLDK